MCSLHWLHSGRGRGRGRGAADGEGVWHPCTKLGRLVKDGRIKSIEECYLFSVPIKEYQIIDQFLPGMKDEVMKISPVQKQTSAGQRTRFKAYVAVGDSNGHIGLGGKCSKEVANAIRGALIAAKLAVIQNVLDALGYDAVQSALLENGE